MPLFKFINPLTKDVFEYYRDDIISLSYDNFLSLVLPLVGEKIEIYS